MAATLALPSSPHQNSSAHKSMYAEMSTEDRFRDGPPIGEKAQPPQPEDSSSAEEVYVTGFKVWISTMSSSAALVSRYFQSHFLTEITKLAMIIAALTLILFLVILDTSIISTAVPRITSEFNSLTDIGWYASAYNLACASIQPLSGTIYRKFNTKNIFLGFFAIFQLGSLLCGIANSSMMLIIGRAVAGMGTAGIFNGGLGMVMACAPLHRRPGLIGIMIGISQIGMISGPLIGGAFTEYASWRWCFYVNLPVGAVGAIILVLLSIPEEKEKAQQSLRQSFRTLGRDLDLVGFALMAPATIQLLLALEYGGSQFPWSSATVIGLFVGAGATAAVWLAWNWYRGDAALVPLSVMRRTTVWASAMTQMGLNTALLCASYYLPIYFQAVRGASPLMSGVYLLPNILGQVLGAVLSGYLVERTGYVIPYSLFSTSITATATGLYALFTPSTSTGMWVGIQLLAGVARGAGLQMGMLAVQAILGPEEISIGIALLMFTEFMGLSITMIAADTVFNESIVSQLAEHAPDINGTAVIAAGAAGFRDIVAPSDIPNVLLAYSNSVDRTFYVPAAVAAVSFVTSFFMGWVDLRKKKDSRAGTEGAA